MRRTAAFLFFVTMGAIVVSVDFATLPAWMNPKFYASLWDHNRFNLWVGGAGSGKSVGAAQRYVYRLTAETGHNLLAMRKVSEANRFSTFAGLVATISQWHLTSLWDINESRMYLRCINGNEVIFRGMNDIRARERVKSVTFKSGPLTDIWTEEASEFEPEDITQLNLRLRGLTPQPLQFLLTFNPVNVQHHLKKTYFDNPKANATILQTTYKDNRFLDSAYRGELEALKDSDPNLYQVYALGEWGQLGDQAFPNAIFGPCRYKYEDFDRVLVGKDFGFQHYDALEFIGLKDDELYSFRELYVRQRTNPEIIELSLDILDHSQRVRADSAEPKSIAEWNNAGFYLEPAVKGPDSVKAQYAYLRGHRWHIDPDACPGLAAEVRGAVYRKDRFGNLTEEIFSFHDDAMAACRYAIEELLTPANTFKAW